MDNGPLRKALKAKSRLAVECADLRREVERLQAENMAFRHALQRTGARVTPGDFGAVGDGITDCLPAIMAFNLRKSD